MILYHMLCALLILGVLAGIAMMSKVTTAAKGNSLSAFCMAAAIVLTLGHYQILTAPELWICMALGLGFGLWWAARIKMIQMPQVVALLNGFGGAASALVAMIVLLDHPFADAFVLGNAGLALAVGMVTLTGSLVAAGKLHQMLPQRPVVWKNHKAIGAVLLLAMLASIVIPLASGATAWTTALCFFASAAFGVVFAIRVGGADMPVTISLLNSLSGVAGGIAGIALGDLLLVAVGGIVGASGLLLTQIMCGAMNRHLADLLLGKTSVVGAGKPKASDAPAPALQPARSLDSALRNAKRVIIVPGYGMALAQAQQQVAQLADRLEKNGAIVDFAIHPVAGRMPGHMNVLLAEANVPYEKLREMDDINPEFAICDIAIVIGANDVVNPAANTAEGTPIYGMPVLEVDKAKHIIICNFDQKPGYAGVPNPLYEKANVDLRLGDAAETVSALIARLEAKPGGSAAQASGQNNNGNVGKYLAAAKRVIIVPGYGMALAQAQQTVAQLADRLEKNGATVDFAIHPVAGRMPGHMNVLLAEANVPYEKLREMDDINPEFPQCDVAIVIGANDVVNPAANTAEGTPIYGMPVLEVEKAARVIVCNYDDKPGYAGVPNPLYEQENVTMLFGDAAQSVARISAFAMS